MPNRRVDQNRTLYIRQYFEVLLWITTRRCYWSVHDLRAVLMELGATRSTDLETTRRAAYRHLEAAMTAGLCERVKPGRYLTTMRLRRENGSPDEVPAQRPCKCEGSAQGEAR